MSEAPPKPEDCKAWGSFGSRDDTGLSGTAASIRVKVNAEIIPEPNALGRIV